MEVVFHPTAASIAALEHFDELARKYRPLKELIAGCFSEPSKFWTSVWLWTRLSVQTCFLQPTTHSNVKLVQLVQNFYAHLCLYNLSLFKYVDQKELLRFFTDMWSRDSDYRHSTTIVALLLTEDFTLTGQLIADIEMDMSSFIQFCLYHIEFAFDQWCSKPDNLTSIDFWAQVAMLYVLESREKRLLPYIAASHTAGRLSLILDKTVRFLMEDQNIAIHPSYGDMLGLGIHTIRNLLALVVRLTEVGPLYLIEALNNQLFLNLFALEQLWKADIISGSSPHTSSEVAGFIRRVLTNIQRHMYHFPTFRRLKHIAPILQKQAEVQETNFSNALELRAAWSNFSECYLFALDMWNRCHGLVSHSGKNRCQNPQVSARLQFF
jgi:hypothetical protein